MNKNKNNSVLSVAVFVSGRGSNLQAILDSPKLKDLVSVKAVVSNKSFCPAFEIAKEKNIFTCSVGSKDGFVSYNQLKKELAALNINLIVLAGFLKLIPADFISAFKNKIINIHPALLPSFGGPGMYGMRVHQAVFNSSAKVSGATVHFVDETYDTGKIIAQRCVDIKDAASPEEIARRVLKVEHELLPDVIYKFAVNKISFNNNRVILL